MAAASYVTSQRGSSYALPPGAAGSFGPPGPTTYYAPPPTSALSPGRPPQPAGPIPSSGQNVSFAAEKPALPGRTPSVSLAAQPFEDPATLTPLPPTKQGIKNSKATAEYALREYMSLQKIRLRNEEIGIDERLRVQASHVLDDLRSLRRDVADIVKDAETHRWRRWFTGSIIASFVPAVRAIFRKPNEERGVANDTEYAFRKSRSLIARIRESVHGTGRWASIAFFVFAVLYVFSNEVSLRVARTVGKRLKRLSARVENGEEIIDGSDMMLLDGWRWRILLLNR